MRVSKWGLGVKKSGCNKNRGKLEANWEGPLRVINVLAGGAYESLLEISRIGIATGRMTLQHLPNWEEGQEEPKVEGLKKRLVLPPAEVSFLGGDIAFGIGSKS
ncbi:hypothetical protein DH2020_029031 [Rehmannia glutinosa]|uniref:Uncharacterized protein n=1 Tax=Rehmannia glutinosa TaxID=99300 RepID=A0ABR0VQL6_REHGL